MTDYGKDFLEELKCRAQFENMESSWFYCIGFRYFMFEFESRQNSHQKSQNYTTKVAKKITVNEMVIINLNKSHFAQQQSSVRRSRRA